MIVAPGTKLESGPATLHLCNDILVVARDVPQPWQGSGSWPDLRALWGLPNRFIFEAGPGGFCRYVGRGLAGRARGPQKPGHPACPGLSWARSCLRSQEPALNPSPAGGRGWGCGVHHSHTKSVQSHRGGSGPGHRASELSALQEKKGTDMSTGLCLVDTSASLGPEPPTQADVSKEG